jgi:hypothetical protein
VCIGDIYVTNNILIHIYIYIHIYIIYIYIYIHRSIVGTWATRSSCFTCCWHALLIADMLYSQRSSARTSATRYTKPLCMPLAKLNLERCIQRSSARTWATRYTKPLCIPLAKLNLERCIQRSSARTWATRCCSSRRWVRERELLY